MQTNIVDVTLENFQQTVIENSEKLPVLVDFWAPWCHPCKQVMPILEKLAETHKDRFILAKVNTEEQQKLSDHFQIQSLPTFKICHQGKIVQSLQGVQSPTTFLEALEKYMPADESENLRQQAKAESELQNWEHAEKLLSQASQINPNNFKIHLDIAMVYINQGSPDAAKRLIAQLPQDIQASPEALNLLSQIKYAEVLAEAPTRKDIESQLASDPNNPELLYTLALYQTQQQQTQAAMDSLLKLFIVDRHYQDGIAKKTLLEMFDNLTNSDSELVNRYRRKLQNLLF